jgi:hypothetical protein
MWPGVFFFPGYLMENYFYVVGVLGALWILFAP